jgi:hypothetical protein
MMSDIYRGSYCNIAATYATDSTIGLYTERDPLEIRGCVVKDPYTLAIFKVETDFYNSREWEKAISTSPLLSRGWVLQELTLAPRTLYFGRDRIFWQCSTQKASEDSPAELRVNRMRYYADAASEDEYKDFHGPSGWANIVHEYSRCELTFPAKDKLVAVSGIAKNYGTGENYLAGLWRENLIPQLTWRAFRGNRAQEYQAPSWSWASVNKELKYSWRDISDGKTARLQLVANLLGTDIVPITEDRFGKVSKGELRIQGSLLKLKYEGDTADRQIGLHYMWGTARRIWPQLHRDSTFSIVPSNWQISVDIDFPEELEYGDILYCMPLYYERDTLANTQSAVHGIILALTGKTRGQYERRGTIFLGDKTMGGACAFTRILDNFARFCREGAKEVSRKCYESRDGRKHGMPMYTITIV